MAYVARHYRNVFIFAVLLLLCASTVYAYGLYLKQRSISSYYLSISMQEMYNSAYLISHKLNDERDSYTVSEIKQIIDYQDRLIKGYTHLYAILKEGQVSKLASPVQFYVYDPLVHLLTYYNWDMQRVQLNEEEKRVMRTLNELSVSIRQIYDNKQFTYSKDVRLADVEIFLKEVTASNPKVLRPADDL